MLQLAQRHAQPVQQAVLLCQAPLVRNALLELFLPLPVQQLAQHAQPVKEMLELVQRHAQPVQQAVLLAQAKVVGNALLELFPPPLAQHLVQHAQLVKLLPQVPHNVVHAQPALITPVEEFVLLFPQVTIPALVLPRKLPAPLARSA